MKMLQNILSNSLLNKDSLIECKICGCIIKINLQFDFSDEIPFIYRCPKCNSLIKGRICLGDNTLILKNPYNCKGYNYDSSIPIKYTLQISNVLYTEKMRNNSADKGHHKFMSVESKDRNAFNEYSTNFNNSILPISCIIDYIMPKRLPKFNAMLDLLKKDSNSKYLNNMMHKYKCISENKNIDQFSLGFKIVKIFNYLCKPLWNYKPFLNDIMCNNIGYIVHINDKFPKQINILLQQYDNTAHVYYFIKIFQDLIINFCDCSKNILPTIVNYCLNAVVEPNKNRYSDYVLKNMGIFQTDFNSLKWFYSSNYELIADVCPFIVLLQNIINRGSIYKFNPLLKSKNARIYDKISPNNISELDSNKTHLVKLALADSKTLIPKSIFKKSVNNHFRNSITHEFYDYDYNNQIIKFHDVNGYCHKTYLIEFSKYIFQDWIIACQLLLDIMLLRVIHRA